MICLLFTGGAGTFANGRVSEKSNKFSRCLVYKSRVRKLNKASHLQINGVTDQLLIIINAQGSLSRGRFSADLVFGQLLS